MSPVCNARGRALVLGALALAGCGGSASAELPSCVSRVSLPVKVTILPERARVYAHTERLGFDVWSAVAPGSLDDVREDLGRRLEDAGYELGEGEVEEHDAEAEFEGNGQIGRLKLRDVAGCEGAVNVELAIRQQ